MEDSGKKIVSTAEMVNLSLGISTGRYPRDFLHSFTGGGSSSNNPFETAKEEKEEMEVVEVEEGDEEIELNLGLSLGGRFGVDKNSKLGRSSSIASCLPVVRDDNDPVTPPTPVLNTGLTRTSSLPVETEDEWKKRKELQTLRRMEAKRRRSEKQKNSKGDRGGRGKLMTLEDRERLEREKSSGGLQRQGSMGLQRQGSMTLQQQGSTGLQRQGSTGLQRQGSIALQPQGSTGLQRQGSMTLQQQGSTGLQRQGSMTLQQQVSTGLQRQGSTALKRQGSTALQRQGSAALPRQGSMALKRQDSAQFGPPAGGSDVALAIESHPRIGGGMPGAAQPGSQESLESKGASSSSVSDRESKSLQGSTGEVSPRSMQSGSNQEANPSAPRMRESASRPAAPTPDNPSTRPTTSRAEQKTQVAANSLEEMPGVFTKGDGPQGRRVDGILYRYGRGEEVRIMCVCHGTFHSPAEFVEHAGGTDVENPLKHIVIKPSSSLI